MHQLPGGQVRAKTIGCISHMLWHMLVLPLLRGVIGHDLGRGGILHQQSILLLGHCRARGSANLPFLLVFRYRVFRHGADLRMLFVFVGDVLLLGE